MVRLEPLTSPAGLMEDMTILRHLPPTRSTTLLVLPQALLGPRRTRYRPVSSVCPRAFTPHSNVQVVGKHRAGRGVVPGNAESVSALPDSLVERTRSGDLPRTAFNLVVQSCSFPSTVLFDPATTGWKRRSRP